MAFRTNKTPVLQEKTASGSVASFNTILQKPLVNGEFTIEAYQEGSGDPAPDNVRNIVPFNKVNITKTGVNTWSEDWELGDIDNTTGATTPSGVYIRSKDYEIIKPYTQYCVSFSQISVFYYDASKAFISRVLTSYDNQVITTPSNAYFFKIKRYGTTYGNDISLNYPSTQTGYIAYNGEIATVALGEDVYGGSYNSVTGELTLTHQYWSCDDTDISNWTTTATTGRYERRRPSTVNQTSSALWALGFKSNICQTQNRSSSSGATLNNSFYAGSSYLDVRFDSCPTLSDFEALLASEGLQIVSPLLNPITIQLTPEEIQTFNGANNIFCDTGDTSVVFNDLDIAKRGSFREVFKLP